MIAVVAVPVGVNTVITEYCEYCDTDAVIIQCAAINSTSIYCRGACYGIGTTYCPFGGVRNSKTQRCCGSGCCNTADICVNNNKCINAGKQHLYLLINLIKLPPNGPCNDSKQINVWICNLLQYLSHTSVSAYTVQCNAWSVHILCS